MYIKNSFLPKLNDGKLDLDEKLKCGMTFNSLELLYCYKNDNEFLYSHRIKSTQIVIGYSKEENKVYVRDLLDSKGKFVFFNSYTYRVDLNRFLALLGVSNRRINAEKMNEKVFECYKSLKSVIFGEHYVKSEKVEKYTLEFIETLVNNPLVVKNNIKDYRWNRYQINYSKELQILKKKFKKEEINF